MELFVEGFWSVFNSIALGRGAAMVSIIAGFAAILGGGAWLIMRIMK